MSNCNCQVPCGDPCQTCTPCPSIPISYQTNSCSCTPFVYDCNVCTPMAVSQLSRPCYEDPSYCSDGCEETINTECVIVSAQVSDTGANLQEVIRNFDIKYQTVCVILNTLVPDSIISYNYLSNCVLPSLTSVKKNGLEILPLPVTASRGTILMTLQSLDANWVMTATSFQIRGIDIWEINIDC